MKYIRQYVFTLSKINDQLVDYLKKNHKLPKTIYLPPEEFVYINYLIPDNDFRRVIKTYHGIPLKVYYDKQSKKFSI